MCHTLLMIKENRSDIPFLILLKLGALLGKLSQFTSSSLPQSAEFFSGVLELNLQADEREVCI